MPSGVYIRSEEHRKAVREQRLGTFLSAETRRKISESNLLRYKENPELSDRISKDLTGRPKSADHVEKVRQANLGLKRSKETRDRLRISHLGHTPSDETCRKLSEALRKAHAEGRMICPFNDETRAKVIEKNRLRVGPLHPRWIVDRTKLAKKSGDRSVAIVSWAAAVKRRDKHRCALSYLEQGTCNGGLEAHHILSWKSCPERRFDVSNGITLCVGHHPRKRAEELRLVTVFENMVANREG